MYLHLLLHTSPFVHINHFVYLFLCWCRDIDVHTALCCLPRESRVGNHRGVCDLLCDLALPLLGVFGSWTTPLHTTGCTCSGADRHLQIFPCFLQKVSHLSFFVFAFVFSLLLIKYSDQKQFKDLFQPTVQEDSKGVMKTEAENKCSHSTQLESKEQWMRAI